MSKYLSRIILGHFSKKITLSGCLTAVRVETRYLKTMTQVKIGTHDGTFQCDEALACFLLKTLPDYKDAIVVRTRDKSILDTCDIVVDVGAEYDPSRHRYDHHMRDFKETASTVTKKPGCNWQIKLSSAGLVYCHFGHRIIKQLLPEASEDTVEAVFKLVYDKFIQEIDGIDNGVSMFEGEPVYFIKTDLSTRVSYLNPAWNSNGIDTYEQFLKAVALTGQEFTEVVMYTANVLLPAKSLVKEALTKRFEVDPSGEIIVLPQFAPWTDYLDELEKELNIQPSIKCVIYPNMGSHIIKCVPVQPGSFVVKLPLPEAWAGLRDENLVRVSGIEGAHFVHRNQFCGGHKTKEGALMMARKSLEIAKEQN